MATEMAMMTATTALLITSIFMDINLGLPTAGMSAIHIMVLTGVSMTHLWLALPLHGLPIIFMDIIILIITAIRATAIGVGIITIFMYSTIIIAARDIASP